MKKIFWGFIGFLSILFCLSLNINKVSAEDELKSNVTMIEMTSCFSETDCPTAIGSLYFQGWETLESINDVTIDMVFYQNKSTYMSYTRDRFILDPETMILSFDDTYSTSTGSAYINSSFDPYNIKITKSFTSTEELVTFLNSINILNVLNSSKNMYVEKYPTFEIDGVFMTSFGWSTAYTSSFNSYGMNVWFDQGDSSELTSVSFNTILDTIGNVNKTGADDYEQGYQDGQASVDITSDNETIRQEAYDKGFSDGQTSVDITSNDEEIWNEAYQEGNNDGYTLGFEAGKDSIDLEAIKQEEYDRGYNNGYNTGFAEGESSVDITSDNDTVIDAYITINKYHTDVEFNLNYEKGYNAGIEFVYGNLESDTVVNNYVTDYITKNEYHTNTEYIDNYNQGYNKGYNDGYDVGYNKGINDGKEVVYKNVASDPVVKEYWETKLVNGTTINIVNEGNEVVEVVKKYDVNYDSDDDLTINIHNGQDKYHVETVEEVIPGVSTTKEKIVFDYDLLKKAIIVVTASALGVIILVIIGSFLFTPRRKIKTHRKAGNGYVWSR